MKIAWQIEKHQEQNNRSNKKGRASTEHKSTSQHQNLNEDPVHKLKANSNSRNLSSIYYKQLKLEKSVEYMLENF